MGVSIDILLIAGREWVRFMDKSSPLEDEVRELDDCGDMAFGAPFDDERESSGGTALGLKGVTGELSKGEVRSSDGEDVVLVVVLVVLDGVASARTQPPDGAATSPSTTRLKALFGLCGPFEPFFGHPNQLLRRTDLGVGATSGVALASGSSGEVGVGSVMRIRVTVRQR